MLKINVDISGLDHLTDNISRRARYARISMAEQAFKEMNVHVPKREGTLQASGRYNNDGTQLTWPMVYAHYQYLGVSKLGKTNWHYTTPGTGPKWDKTTMADPTAVKHITDAFKHTF